MGKIRYNMDEKYDGPSREYVSVKTINAGDTPVDLEERDGWMTALTEAVYLVVRSHSPGDRDIYVDITINEKGNAAHLRH